MTRCKSVSQYTGVRRPRCAGGKGCDACWVKWASKRASVPEFANPQDCRRCEGKGFYIHPHNGDESECSHEIWRDK